MKCLENRILNEKKQKEKLLTCRSRAYYVSAGQKDPNILNPILSPILNPILNKILNSILNPILNEPPNFVLPPKKTKNRFFPPPPKKRKKNNKKTTPAKFTYSGKRSILDSVCRFVIITNT